MEKQTGQASAEQIAQWKDKYGEVYAIQADNKVCYVRKPDRKTLAYVSTLQHNPIKMAETMLNNCWVGGCEEFKTDDSLFLGACQKLGALVQVKEADLVKL